MITLPEASLLALFLETLFYGVFFTFYWLALVILLKKRGIQRDLLIPVATLLLCIATAHLIINFVRALEAFVFNVDTIGADAYYSNLASPLGLAKTALYITQPTVADSVLIWRCYVLNNRSLLVGIPGCIVLLANGAVGYYIVWSLSQAIAGSTALTTIPGLIVTFYTLTMFISIICTTLISWRIWRSRQSMSDGSADLLPVMIVIVEGGAIYATSVLALLLAFLTGSNGEYPAMDIGPPVVGIVFCLIILQVHFHVGNNPQPTSPPKPFTILFGERGEQNVSHSMEPMIEETEIIRFDVTRSRRLSGDDC
ncbi:uncharacterized protein F5891DRAFT_668859 [Suillus fuscotomentosus]|uniref:Uncharacterized protein n=1 Tax=Suillus fuscotomentosus TaxID=1912939 RepID=A0AAD4HGL7_9AGAM|nr:uncharacterized protein F5891DRAFT_668859 [Suillus fuscotomentosus]KAG1895481.1 hypothetical protein F5891DRAFT_668859 [Suillus fuscotomentosus]